MKILILLLFSSLIALTQDFEIVQFEYHPCITNLLDLDADTEVDTNGVILGQWYIGTNIIKWTVEAGYIYIPEWTFNINCCGSNTVWYSNCYLSTNAPGFLETRFFAYVGDESKRRIYRIAKYDAQPFTNSVTAIEIPIILPE